MPSPFIHSILRARQEGTYSGLGFFDFVWQPAEDPTIFDYLKREDDEHGVVVIHIPSKLGQKVVLKKHDIILKVDGFTVDTQGDYDDPEYGPLSLENLCTRGKWAGDTVQLEIWRDGRAQEVEFILPKASYKTQLVPGQVFDREPEYLIVGGLIFQPLTGPFLSVWGEDSRGRAPFRLSYYEQQEASIEHPALVILSLVLPDPVNLGYQDSRYMVVEKVNDKTVHRLPDLQQALKHPRDGYHVVEFAMGSAVSRMVLDADEAAKATERILQRYGIVQDHYFAGDDG
jgi:hypothetical protein